MICVGVDIISIKRIEKFCERFGRRGLGKFLNDKEIEIIKNPQSIAGFWAAKEACSKALGCGIGSELSFMDILISKSKRGAPLISLKDERLDYFKVESLSLSISHDSGFAIAVVVANLKHENFKKGKM